MRTVPRVLFGLKALIFICLFYKVINVIWNFEDYFNPSPFHGKTYAWTSPYSGWYNRSTALNISQIQSLRLDADSLILTASSTAWGNVRFQAALFRPGICILKDEVRMLDGKDFEGFAGIVKKIEKKGLKTRHWNMLPSVSDLSTKKLRIREEGKSMEAAELKLYTAYGLNKYWRYKESASLPKVVAEIFGLVDHDETCCRESGEGDETMNREVKRLKDEIIEIIQSAEGDHNRRFLETRRGSK